jgi:acetate kinase
MAVEPLVLVTNPGSSSRKYAFYRRGVELASAHIEHVKKKLVLHLRVDKKTEDIQLHDIINLTESLDTLLQICLEKNILHESVTVDAVAIRIVAPSAHFLQDRILTDHEITLLKKLHDIAPLHLEAILHEISDIRSSIPNVPIIGVSDSAFHATKPDYTWNYGINLHDADKFDIKRFGYHGISVESVMKQVKATKYAPYSKVIVCHLGSGASITAVYNGKSIDTTMGYSPNEGLIMATRSGTVEFSAGLALSKYKNISPDELLVELNSSSGLLGISGASDDIRELLKLEAAGNHRAELALCMYVYTIRQAIARMVASLEGVDMIVFTGTVGQRSAVIRNRIVSGLEYLGIVVSASLNAKAEDPIEISPIHPRTRSKPVLVVPTREERAIASRARKLLLN